jgi:photosystem II stability/assembly factor-like uncharacterized protein
MNLDCDRINTIVQHPFQKNILAVGTEDHGVFVSTDFGKKWIRSEGEMQKETIYSITLVDSKQSVLFAGGFRTGVLTSKDGGMHWSKSGTGIENQDIHSIVIDPNDQNRMYAGTIGNGVFHSTDAGVSWKNIGLQESKVWSLFLRKE